MNKRIQEMAEQAGIVIPKDSEYNGHIYRNSIEKFAKLIVQECISTVEGIEPGYKDYRDQIEDAFRRDCVAEIKHKFGVEE